MVAPRLPFTQELLFNQAMAQATNPKIEELRARIKSDPKSRLFFPLAEELRKMGGLDEAEQALRHGLEQHPTYLSAWVSLGRVLRERGDSPGVIEVLTKALQLDPGNVVAARMLADTYLEMGQKVEAIKKYKLVHALLPQDQEVESLIEKLDAELNPPAPLPISHYDDPASIEPDEPTPFALSVSNAGPEAIASGEAFPAATTPAALPGEAFPPTAEHAPPAGFAEDQAPDQRRAHPDAVSAEEPAPSRPSQFDDTAPLGYDSHAFTIEHPAGMHIIGSEDEGLDADVIAPATDEAFPWAEAEPRSPVGVEPVADRSRDLFAPGHEVPSPWLETPAPAGGTVQPRDSSPEHAADDVTNTITMGDLYARQGLVDDAREIYSRVLERDPGNESIRAKLDHLQQTALPGARENAAAAKAARLQAWLSRVKRGSEDV